MNGEADNVRAQLVGLGWSVWSQAYRTREPDRSNSLRENSVYTERTVNIFRIVSGSESSRDAQKVRPRFVRRETFRGKSPHMLLPSLLPLLPR